MEDNFDKGRKAPGKADNESDGADSMDRSAADTLGTAATVSNFDSENIAGIRHPSKNCRGHTLAPERHGWQRTKARQVLLPTNTFSLGYSPQTT